MRAPLLAFVVALVGCLSNEAPPEPSGDQSSAATRGASDLQPAFRRVVMGRIYQHDKWTLPAADTYQADRFATVFERRVAYVCDTYAALDPTFVSGLVRLDDDETVDGERVETFKAIRQCIRERVTGHVVRFDVVLNALQYSDPDTIPTAAKGAELLQQRLEEVRTKLDPDFYFFDFFTVPFNRHDKDWHADAISRGMDWIHAHDRFVGGNFWGKNVPKGTDFAAVDDSGGIDDTRAQSAAILANGGGKLPLVIHVRNDPQVPGSEGLKFISGDLAYRRSVVTSEAALSSDLGCSYGLPVFFPLRIDGADRFAYDARQDGAMLEVLQKLGSR